MKKHFADYFSGHAADYQKFRPDYPPALFEYLAFLGPTHECAWDCATGNGQAAIGLKPFFEKVIATDASARQIAQAQAVGGIEYLVAPAEQTTIAAGSIDLVTVAQALHWFDRPRFFAEARRVLKPRGAIACWCYGLMSIDPTIDAIVRRLYGEILGDDWPPERRLVESGYATIEFPFERMPAPDFEMSRRWDFRRVVGYLQTWSAVKEYQRKHQADPLALIGRQLLAAWGDPATERRIVWKLSLLIGI